MLTNKENDGSVLFISHKHKSRVKKNRGQSQITKEFYITQVKCILDSVKMLFFPKCNRNFCGFYDFYLLTYKSQLCCHSKGLFSTSFDFFNRFFILLGQNAPSVHILRPAAQQQQCHYKYNLWIKWRQTWLIRILTSI